MGVLLALLSALSWGSSDFVAGLTNRRTAGMALVVSSQALSLVLVSALATLVGGEVDASSMLWGAAGGVGSGAGVALLYRALAVGPMSVVAPLTGVLAAAVPVVAGLGLSERPSGLALVGTFVALPAVLLVSMAPAPADDGAGGGAEAPGGRVHKPRLDLGGAVVPAVVAGLGFGLFYVCFDRASAESGLWPVVAARIASVGLLGGFALATGRAVAVPRVAWAGTAAVGVLDILAVTLYLLASRQDLLPVVGVVASLYPVATIVLARMVLSERLSAKQMAGLAVAGVGIGLIAVG